MSHPYASMSADAFWRSSVTIPGRYNIRNLWTPKWSLCKSDRIVTAGSCFAQHIGQALAKRGLGWIDAEPAPPFLKRWEQKKFGYGVFSFRTGNIYTPSMMNQWLALTFGGQSISDEIWEHEGRWYDPLRPRLEPDGFASEEELRNARHATLSSLRRNLPKVDILVFTLGLTEHWVNVKTGLEYAMCPGTTTGGVYSDEVHAFRNHTCTTLRQEMDTCLQTLSRHAPNLKVLLTVSPVPLAATASGAHVLTATSWSKSVLRAVAGELAQDYDNVDYFPSFEIITNPVFEGKFYDESLRNVTEAGVSTVMEHFFHAQTIGEPPLKDERPRQRTRQRQERHAADVQCEEAWLDAFATR